MRVLLAAQDPGGANVIWPLAKYLRRREKTLLCGADFALPLWRRHQLRAVDCSSASLADLRQLVRRFLPEVIVLGTSVGFSLEKKLTRLARQMKIPTVSLIDSWMNYRLRFANASQPEELSYLTDVVCVIDQNMKRDCVRSGIPSERIRITGSPYLQAVLPTLQGRGKEKNQLLFVSQPLSSPPYNSFPFDEYKVLTDLLSYPHLSRFERLIIKLHPKEQSTKFQTLLSKYSHLKIFLTVTQSGDVYKLVKFSSVIVGMNSMVLLEAALAGKQVISYQPGLPRKHDVLPTNQLGLSRGCYSKRSFYRALGHYGADDFRESSRRQRQQIQKQYGKQNAIDNLRHLLYTLAREKKIISP